MSAPRKEGLLYFSFDVGFFRDDKIRLLRAEHNAEGVEIYQRLLCKCYENNGYYLAWNNKTDYALMADESGYSIEKVRLIVASCIKWSLFDDTLFNVGNVLTSRSIQRRFFEAVKATRIKAASNGRYTIIEKGMCLLNEDDLSELNKTHVWLKVALKESNSENNNGNSKNNNGNSENNAAKKSKVKKSKVNESKGDSEEHTLSEKRAKDDYFSGYSFSEQIQSAITDWLAYKKERGQVYKPIGQKSLLSQIRNKLNEFTEQQVIYAITESMARTYQGIIWDTAKPLQSQSQQSQQRQPQKKNRFVNFEGRKWDFAELERQEREFQEQQLRDKQPKEGDV